MKKILAGLLAVTMMLPCVSCGTSTAKKENEITIYLDKTNGYVVRKAIGRYELARKSDEKNYPEISWNLVDKSYMSADELQNEIMEELKAGEGPDLVFVDKMSVNNPYELMGENYLYDMKDLIDGNEKKQTYIPGSLEEGSVDGKQYLIPISVTTPLLYSTEASLEGAGTEDFEFSDMSDVFDLAAEYKSSTGNDIFTDDNMWNNMLMFSGLLSGCKDEKEIIDRLSTSEAKDFFKKLQENYSDEGYVAYGGYDKIMDNTALIGTEIVESICDFYKNAVLFKRDDSLQYADMPDLYGKKTAIITQAVGINKNTDNKELVYNAVKMFDESHVTYNSYLGRNQSANITETRESNLTTCYPSENMMSDETHYAIYNESNSGLKDYGGKEFTKIDELTGKDIESVSYYIADVQSDGKIMEQMIPYLNGECEYENAIENVKSALDKTNKLQKVSDMTTISVAVTDLGEGIDCGIYKWLTKVNESLKDQKIWLDISLVHGTTSDYEFSLMDEAGVGYDLVYLEDFSETTEYTAETEELTKLAEGRLYDGWEKCSYKEGIYLPITVRLGGIWYNKAIASELGIDMQSISTLDDLIAVMEKLKESGKADTCWTNQNENMDEIFNTFVKACGGEYYTTDNKISLDQAVDIEALSYMKSLFGENESSDISEDEAIQRFKNGQLFAIVGDCASVSELLRSNNADLGYIPVPAGKNGSKVASVRYSNGGGFVLSSKSKNKDAALNALGIALDSEQFIEYTDSFYMIPLSKNALSTDKYSNMADWSTVFTSLYRIPKTDVLINAPDGLSDYIHNFITSSDSSEVFYDGFKSVIEGSYSNKELKE